MKRRTIKIWEKERTDKGSECAKKIRREIERLSEFTLKPVGISVEDGYVPGLHVESKDLDYYVFYKDKHVAVIDPTCSNFTFKDSQIMPVNFYKGEIIKQSKVPVFNVYSMEKEDKPLKDRCVWIRGKDVIKCDHWTEELGGKMQHNYFTDKNDWDRGLEKLIEEILNFDKHIEKKPKRTEQQRLG